MVFYPYIYCTPGGPAGAGAGGAAGAARRAEAGALRVAGVTVYLWSSIHYCAPRWIHHPPLAGLLPLSSAHRETIREHMRLKLAGILLEL